MRQVLAAVASPVLRTAPSIALHWHRLELNFRTASISAMAIVIPAVLRTAHVIVLRRPSPPHSFPSASIAAMAVATVAGAKHAPRAPTRISVVRRRVSRVQKARARTVQCERDARVSVSLALFRVLMACNHAHRAPQARTPWWRAAQHAPRARQAPSPLTAPLPARFVRPGLVRCTQAVQVAQHAGLVSFSGIMDSRRVTCVRRATSPMLTTRPRASSVHLASQPMAVRVRTPASHVPLGRRSSVRTARPGVNIAARAPLLAQAPATALCVRQARMRSKVAPHRALPAPSALRNARVPTARPSALVSPTRS